MTPVQIREKLVDLALPIVGKEKKGELLDLLTYKTTPNGGVAVTDDLKYNGETQLTQCVHLFDSVPKLNFRDKMVFTSPRRFYGMD